MVVARGRTCLISSETPKSVVCLVPFSISLMIMRFDLDYDKATMIRFPRPSSGSPILQVSNGLEAATVTLTLPISGALVLDESRILTYSLFVHHPSPVTVEKDESTLFLPSRAYIKGTNTGCHSIPPYTAFGICIHLTCFSLAVSSFHAFGVESMEVQMGLSIGLI
jgi:hypothetical protein